MRVIKKLLDKLNGLHFSQEYLCLSKESFAQPLHVYSTENARITKDITQSHLFVGYSPLIFAFSSSTLGESSDSLDLLFTTRPFLPNEIVGKKDAIASLSLQRIHTLSRGADSIEFYEGIKGRQHFVSLFHQSIMQLNNKLYNKTAGNVFLRGNLYTQVQIAYSLPRKICLITVGENNRYNLFPTDLHGQINKQEYLISLRYEGKACEQVEEAAKIALSDMPVEEYKNVYSLGKNHTKPLRSATEFNFGATHSKLFSLPLPRKLLSYKELMLETSFIHGIHKILLFKIVHEENFTCAPATLSHVHNCYATWRHNQGLSSNFLLR
jgi:hypothetical protein